VPPIGGDYAWKSASIEGIKYIDKLERHGFLDYLIANGHGWFEKFSVQPWMPVKVRKYLNRITRPSAVG
jgi:hypothetical protein